MQDRYAGDIGDFSKFQLLRRLGKWSDARLGVSWYRFPDEDNQDGRHLAYLNQPRFVSREPHLTAALRSVSVGVRSVAALEGAGILPSNTLYFGDVIPPTGGSERVDWFGRSLVALARSRIVLADPDTGYVRPSVTTGSRKFGKYITQSEVNALLEIAPLVVVYQHFHRKKGSSHHEQARLLAQQCASLREAKHTLVLRFGPYSPRMYVLLARNPWANDLSRSVVNDLCQDFPDFWQRL